MSAVEPGASHRREALRLPFSPALGKRRQHRAQRLLRRERRTTCLSKARGRDRPFNARMAREVHADTEHHPVYSPPGPKCGFEKNAGDFAAIHQDIVRPLAARPARQQPVHQIVDRKRGDEGELRDAPRLAGRAKDRRDIEVAGRRDPGAAPASAPCPLHARPDHRALGRAGARMLLGLVVGAAGLVEGDQSVARRQRRRRHGRAGGDPAQGMSAAAAASAPARIGAG